MMSSTMGIIHPAGHSLILRVMGAHQWTTLSCWVVTSTVSVTAIASIAYHSVHQHVTLFKKQYTH